MSNEHIFVLANIHRRILLNLVFKRALIRTLLADYLFFCFDVVNQMVENNDVRGCFFIVEDGYICICQFLGGFLFVWFFLIMKIEVQD